MNSAVPRRKNFNLLPGAIFIAALTLSAMACRPGNEDGDLDRDTSQVLYTDVEAFENRLHASFAERDTVNHPFVLIAIRVDSQGDDSMHRQDYGKIRDTMLAFIGDEDSVLADSLEERLIVYLHDAHAEEASTLFRYFEAELSKDATASASDLITRTTAMVVENGRYFSSSRDYLFYALYDSVLTR